MTGSEPGEQYPGLNSTSIVSSLAQSLTRPDQSALRSLRDRAIAMALRRPFEVPAPPEIHGARIGRRVVRAGDLIDVRLAKYLQHAVREEQWPAGTTVDEFLESLRTIIADDRGGIFADRHDVGWRLTFVGRSDIWEGLDGGPVIVVVYDCRQERLVTAFQPTRGLAYVEDNARVIDGQWLTRLR